MTNERPIIDNLLDACAIGAGDSVGLPVVPEDKIESTLVWIRNQAGNDPLLMELLSDECTECNVRVDEMDDEDDDAHMIVQDFVVIGCEGFHTAALGHDAPRAHVT